MLASTIITILTTTLLAATNVSAATLARRDGCYKRGMLYSDLSNDVESFKINARTEACNFFTQDSGELSRYATKEFTYKNPNKDGTCVKFSVYNKSNGSRKLGFDECMNAMGTEMNGCVYGSYQWHGDFYYYNDPQAAQHC